MTTNDAQPVLGGSPQKHVVLVTAGASGIGRVIARRFERSGAEVYLCDVDQGALTAVCEPGSSIKGELVDVSKPDEVRAWITGVSKIAGRVDVLVNNAGIAGPRGPIEEIGDKEWERTLAVNLNGAFYCLREVARVMKSQRRGVVINISTSSVRSGLPNRTAYIVSKSGLMGLTLNAARELGRFNIRVNALLPGYVDGPRAAAVTAAIAKERGVSTDHVQEEALKFISMRTMVKAEDVAEMAVFLASDGARFVSGQFIGVDGHQEWEG